MQKHIISFVKALTPRAVNNNYEYFFTDGIDIKTDGFQITRIWGVCVNNNRIAITTDYFNNECWVEINSSDRKIINLLYSKLSTEANNQHKKTA